MKDLTPLVSFIVFDPATITFSISPNNNTLIKVYDLKLHATIVPDITYQ